MSTKRYTHKQDITNANYVSGKYCDMTNFGCFQGEAIDYLAELEDKIEKGTYIEVPTEWLNTLKLLTCAAMCYADIKRLMESKMKDSQDISDLYFKCPNVQGSPHLWALHRLADSKLDCNKINGFEEVIRALNGE